MEKFQGNLSCNFFILIALSEKSLKTAFPEVSGCSPKVQNNFQIDFKMTMFEILWRPRWHSIDGPLTRHWPENVKNEEISSSRYKKHPNFSKSNKNSRRTSHLKIMVQTQHFEENPGFFWNLKLYGLPPNLTLFVMIFKRIVLREFLFDFEKFGWFLYLLLEISSFLVFSCRWRVNGPSMEC